MSLPESLERAATALQDLADRIRPANGDPHRLLEELESSRAAELLRWMLVNASESAEELVEAWGEWEKGAEVLLGVSDAEMSSLGATKAARKVLRKAHHRLRSRGIEVVADAPPKVSKKQVVAVDDPFEAAALSTPDFRGARVGYLADRHPAGGARLFEIRFDEGRGILDFKLYNAGRSKVRGFLRSLSSAQAQRLFDVPRTALCALVRRASQAQPADRPLPSGFVEWRGRMFPESLEKESTPGGLARAAWNAAGGMGRGKPDHEAALVPVLAAITEGSVGPWPPPTSWMSEWMDQARDAARGLEGDARERAIETWHKKVAEALAARDDRDLLARTLEELAWVRWQSDGLEAAGPWILTADAIASEPASDQSSDGTSDDPFDQASDASAWHRIAEARVESLFAPFSSELRVGDTVPDAK
jgi:hypothetical protein